MKKREKPAVAQLLIKDATVHCPACGSTDLGTFDQVECVARVIWNDNRLEYSGETEVLWDTQRTKRRNILYCITCGQHCQLPEGYGFPV